MSNKLPSFASPVTWDVQSSYEALEIVIYDGHAYTSKQAVPAGTSLSNTDYWCPTGNIYNVLNELSSSLANYSRVTPVTTLDTANGTFTATEAGYLWVYCVKNDDNSSSEYILQISSVNVLRYRVTGDVKVYNSFLIPMSKGDTVTCNTVTNMYQLATNNVKFIPKV